MNFFKGLFGKSKKEESRLIDEPDSGIPDIGPYAELYEQIQDCYLSPAARKSLVDGGMLNLPDVNK